MSYRNFSDYVEGLSDFDDNLALTMKSFLKIDRVSYREMRTRAYQAAHYLSDRGVGPGDRVMVVANNCPQWVELLLGSQLLGAILVPVDVSSTLTTTRRFIKETGPKLVFTDRYLYAELGHQATTLLLDELDEAIVDYPAKRPKNQLAGNQPALIVFTSGTMADPKGVVLTQRNVLANISDVQQKFDIGADWRLLSVLPLSHMYELTGSLSVLSRGASIFYIPRVTPLAIGRALVDYQINTVLAIPQLLILLLERIQQTAAQTGKAKVLAISLKIAGLLPFLSRRLLFHSVHAKLGGHLNLVVTGGAPIPVGVATAWEQMGVKALQGYGLTETSPLLTANSLDDRRLDSAGQVMDSVRLRIDKSGEIQAKGPNVFSEYWHNPEATKATFTQDGWFRTGDIGSLQDGWLHIQGRLKFAIVLSSGLKVFPEDVELVAANYPIFKAVCVVGVKRPKGEAVLAVIISDKSDRLVAQAIAEINAQLESFQHIDEWRRWPADDFPRTRLLKVDHRQVQLWANASDHDKPTNNNATEATEDPIINIINLSRGGADSPIRETDRLADLGLDSLRRFSVISLVEGQLGVTIPEETITKTTTVADLRKLVSQGSQAGLPERRPHWPYWRWVRVIGNGLRETLLHGLLRIWVSIKVEGRENLSGLSSPAIFIFNHVDNFDGPVIYQALPLGIRGRLTVAAADDVLRRHKVLTFITRLCFAGFNLARSEPYMPSLEYVSRMIDQGWHVAIAPEGRISPSGRLQPFKSGIGLLAVNLGVPIIPVKTIGLKGTVPLHANWPKKHSRVTVRIGQPISFGPHLDYDAVTKALHRLMDEL